MVKCILFSMGLKVVTGIHYMNVLLGGTESQSEWIKGNVGGWVGAVRKMSGVVHRYPQAAYNGM